MESAQQAEEELQQSVVVSEEDMEADDSSAADGNNRLPTASPSSRRADSAAEEPQEMQDVAGIQQCPPQQPSQPHEHYTETTGPAQDGDDGSDDDISPEEGDTKQEHWVEGGDDLPNALSDKDDQDAPSSLSDSSASSASDEDADDEAVGAVKIRPGEIDDDASHDSDSEGTEETESAAAWEDARDGDAEGDEDSEAVASNTCIFCKEDEEHDPGEEFEELLECISCGEYCKQTYLQPPLHTIQVAKTMPSQHINSAHVRPALSTTRVSSGTFNGIMTILTWWT
jgi:histone acetyltransferase SAS3